MPTIDLVHRAQIPPEAGPNQPAPVVVMVHGWLGDETVMGIFKQTVPPGAAVIAPRAPFALNGGYIWYQRDQGQLQPETESLWAGRNQLAEFLAGLPDHYPVDPSRMVLMGFSQGAALCNTIALTQPGQVQGVASLAGLIPDVVVETAQPDLAGLPVFIAHGSQDETIPLAAARQARDVYTRWGAQVTYGEYPTGHKLTTQGMADLKKWLAKIIVV
jgi:phospholipase/carboxylesterase